MIPSLRPRYLALGVTGFPTLSPVQGPPSCVTREPPGLRGPALPYFAGDEPLF